MSIVRKYLYAFVSAFLAFMGIFLYAKGRSDQKNANMRDDLDAMREAKDVRETVHKDPDLKSRANQWVKRD